ncbi:MAG: VWA domain-containing protein, partial [Alcaligenaceae bacterium]
FTAPKAKPLPVILLLDVSSSMLGEKIQNLNDAVRDMLNEFRDTATCETEISVAIITFGAAVKLHQPMAAAGDVQWQNLQASGNTPLGVALEMAKAMIEDKDVVPSRAYRPTVVLVSDGQPNDDWQGSMNAFIRQGRSAKCDRMAMAIGMDADEAVLGQFIADTPHRLLRAENAKKIRDAFKYVTMSVTVRTKSQTPNVIPQTRGTDAKPATGQASHEHSPPVTQKGSKDDGGYW